jgi:hypothetical protein
MQCGGRRQARRGIIVLLCLTGLLYASAEGTAGSSAGRARDGSQKIPPWALKLEDNFKSLQAQVQKVVAREKVLEHDAKTDQDVAAEMPKLKTIMKEIKYKIKSEADNKGKASQAHAWLAGKTLAQKASPAVKPLAPQEGSPAGKTHGANVFQSCPSIDPGASHHTFYLVPHIWTFSYQVCTQPVLPVIMYMNMWV